MDLIRHGQFVCGLEGHLTRKWYASDRPIKCYKLSIPWSGVFLTKKSTDTICPECGKMTFERDTCRPIRSHPLRPPLSWNETKGLQALQEEISNNTIHPFLLVGLLV